MYEKLLETGRIIEINLKHTVKEWTKDNRCCARTIIYEIPYSRPVVPLQFPVYCCYPFFVIVYYLILAKKRRELSVKSYLL